MKKVKIVRELRGFQGQAVLVRRGKKHFVVSSVTAPFSGFETLVFPATKEGEITDWSQVAGGRGVTREAAIAQLEKKGPQPW